MLLKRARLKIEASDTVANYIDRDFLLRSGPKKVNAFKQHKIGADLVKANNSIDIMAELENKNPEEWVIFRARAIDAGGLEKTGEVLWGANDNGDYFSEEELLSLLEDSDRRSFETFIGVPVFVNHENNNVEKARGKIVNAFYDKENHCVWTDGMIDAKAYPELARAVKEGYVTDVSMGCSVKYSHCSYCGHKASTEDEYCDHVRNHKGRKLNGKKVYEENHGIKFIELSAVVDGACENCTIHSVFSGPDLIEKVQEMCKVASTGHYAISDKNKIKLASHEVQNIKKKVDAIHDAGIIITARGEDIDKLNKALDLLKEVSRQILESKDVDYEFLADIGDLLSELQNLIVDLVEAGFANQDQGGNVSDEDVMNAITDTAPGEGGGAAPTTEAPAPEAPVEPAAGGVPAPAAQPMTTPMLASNKEKMEKTADSIKGFKETLSELENIVERIRIARSEGTNMPKSKDLKRMRDANELSQKLAEVVSHTRDPLVFHEGPYSVLVDEDGITAFANGKKISRYTNSVLGEDVVEALKEDPKQIAKNLISHIASNSKGDNAMEKDLKKEALIQNAPPVEEVQEGQLENLEGNFNRKNHPTETTGQVGVTTERQLDNVPKSKETGKGDWNRIRPNDGKTENLQITEGQMEQNGRPTDYGSERVMPDRGVLEGQHKGIQEWQFAQAGYGSERWDDGERDNYLPITEGQFEGKDRIGEALNEVPEGQLAGRRQGDTVGADNRGYLSASDYSDRVVTAFIDGLATAVASHDITPKTIASIRPNAAPIKTAKVALDGIGKELRKSDIQKIAEYHIARSIGVNQDLADPYIDEVIDVLYSDTTKLASAVKDVLDGRIADLQKVASEEKSAKTVESKVKSAWNKRTAAPIKTQRYVLTTSEITASIPEGKAPEINNKTINDPAVKSLIANYISEGKGGLSITNAQIDESGVVTVFAQESTQNPSENASVGTQAPAPQAPAAEVEPLAQETPETSAPEAQIAASTKEQLKKLAQSPAGTTMPPPGGAMGAPAAGGAPEGGVESLAPPETGDFDEGMGDEDFGDEDLGGEAQPFGAISPISGSDDVEFVDGVYKDNTTGVEYTVDVNYRILNPHVLQNPDFMDNAEEEGAPEEDMTEGEGVNDELNANPTGMQGPAIPGGQPAGGGAPGGMGGGGGGLGGGLMANAPSWVKTASLRYDIVMDPMLFDSEYVEAKNDKGKVVKTAVYKPGHLCPQCGSTKVAFAENQGECANCGCKTYVEAEKRNDGKLHIQMVVDNNLELREATNEWGGHAFNGPVENREEILERVHQILASRKSLVKVAQSLPDDPWLNCVSDQVSDGFDGDNAIQICASLKDAYLKTAMEDDSMEDEDMVKESDEDETVFENEPETDSEDDDMEEVEGPEEEDGTEPEDSFEDDDDGFEEVVEDDEFEDVLDEDLGDEDAGDFGTEQAIDVENITHIDIYGTTPDGEEFEVEIPVNGPGAVDSPVADDDMDILEVEEVFEGEPDDVIDVLDEEGGDVLEDEEVDDDYGLGDIFTMPEDPNAIDEEEEDEDEDDEEFAGMGHMANDALYLRSGRVASANRPGMAFLTDDSMTKLAQLMGLSMPTDTKANERGAKIPRDEEEYGLREDGEALDTSEYENTAANMSGTKDGNAAGSSVAYDPAVAGAERGVRQVKPSDQGNRANKAAGTGSWVKVSGTEDSQWDKSNQRKDKHPVSPTPNDDGSRECCEEDKSGNMTESAKKNTNPNSKRTKVHFKEDSEIEVEAGKDGDFDHGGHGKKRKNVHHKDHSEMKSKKNKKNEDHETAGSGCGYKEKSSVKASGKNPFVRGAQTNNSPTQTEPVDAITEDKVEDNSIESSLDIPRSDEKAKPQEYTEGRDDVNNPDEIRSSEYDMGPNAKNLHNTSIIPRDGSGDGIGGDSTSFEDEKAKGATSGKPDTYVQKFQNDKYVDPTPAGQEDNHATMGVNTASMKKIIQKFASANGFDEADLEAVNFGDVINIEQLSTGRLFEVRVKK